MQVTGRQHKSKTNLADLYRYRDRLVSLIRSMERYQRKTAGPIKQCSAQASRPAAEVQP